MDSRTIDNNVVQYMQKQSVTNGQTDGRIKLSLYGTNKGRSSKVVQVETLNENVAF